VNTVSVSTHDITVVVVVESLAPFTVTVESHSPSPSSPATLVTTIFFRPGRAKKISTVKPCESRESLQQAHLQANPGDEFPVEWATGHEGSTGNWVLVRAEDEMKLVQWSFGLGDKYISGAPSSEKYQTYHVTGVQGSKIGRLATSSSCGVKGKPVFSKEVDKATAHNRPSSFVPIAMDKVAKGTEGVPGSAHLHLETAGAMKFFQYSDDMKDMCKNSIW